MSWSNRGEHSASRVTPSAVVDNHFPALGGTTALQRSALSFQIVESDRCLVVLAVFKTAVSRLARER